MDERYTVEQRPYSVLAIDTGALLTPVLRPGEPTPYLRFGGGPDSTGVPAGADVPAAGAGLFRFAAGSFDLRVVAPLPAPARLALLLRSTDGQPRRRVRCVVTGAGREPVDLQPFDFAGTHRLAVPLDGGRPASMAARDVRVTLVPVDGGPAGTIAGELVEAVLHVTPAVSGDAAAQ